MQFFSLKKHVMSGSRAPRVHLDPLEGGYVRKIKSVYTKTTLLDYALLHNIHYDITFYTQNYSKIYLNFCHLLEILVRAKIFKCNLSSSSLKTKLKLGKDKIRFILHQI